MSKETWEDEFYLVDANYVADKDAGTMILQKWSGLDEETLKQHQLHKVPDNIQIVEDEGTADGHVFGVGIDTCPWCQTDLANREHRDEVTCEHCPAVLAGMETCIDDSNGVSNSPYHYWVETGDTGPMLGWIRRAVKAIDEKECS